MPIIGRNKSIWLNREAKTVPDGVTGVENLLDT